MSCCFACGKNISTDRGISVEYPNKHNPARIFSLLFLLCVNYAAESCISLLLLTYAMSSVFVALFIALH